MTAKMTTMSERNPESIVMKEGVRAPRLGQIADGLVTAVAVSLPWSTSATSILIVLWLIALGPDPRCRLGAARSAVGGRRPAGAAVGARRASACCGPTSAGATASHGLSGFHKLLVIPLLLAQFRRSDQAKWVILGFLASSVVLLVVSWALVLTPGLTWRGHKSLGVPVKDYILQSVIFAICAFGLLGQAAELWRTRASLALVLVLVAALFIANIVYVATARTTLVVMVVLLVMFGAAAIRLEGRARCRTDRRGADAARCGYPRPICASACQLAVEELQTIRASDVNTPIGLRLEYWRKSLAFVAERRSSVMEPGPSQRCSGAM